MLKSLVISSDVDKELVERLSQFYNGLAEGDKAVVMLCTDGGDSDSRDAILMLLQLYSPITTLVGYYELCSAGFEIFFQFKGKRELADGCTGMYHRAYASISIDSAGKIKGEGAKFLMEELKGVAWDKALAMCKEIGVTTNEIKKITKGEDVYFTYEQMKTFLKNSTPPF